MKVLQDFADFYQSLSKDSLSMLNNIYASDCVLIDPVARHEGLENVKNYFANLLQNTSSCRCNITSILQDGNNCAVSWDMHLVHERLNGGNQLTVNGMSKLTFENDRIVLHRDYFDMGQMVYEQIPVLKIFIKAIKKRIVQ